MRRFHLGLFASASIAFVVLPVVGCEDSSSSSGGPVLPDGGGDFETGPLPDGAGPVEAQAEAAPTGISVTVLDGVTPKADVRVIFHDESGTVMSDLKTDATGKVSAGTAPSMVTVLAQAPNMNGGGPRVLTYTGVTGGDVLTVRLPQEESVTADASYSVSFAAPFGGANGYEARVSSCSQFAASVTAPIVLQLFADCLGPTNAVLGVAMNGSDAIAYGFLKNVARPPAGPAVAVGPITLAAKGTLSVTATNRPGVPGGVNVVSLVGGTTFYTGNASGSLATNDVTVPYAVGFADAIQSYVDSRGPSGNTSVAIVRREAAPAGATAAISFDFATALPLLSTYDVDTTTPARPVVGFTTTAPQTAADAGVVGVRWTVTGGGATTGYWTVLTPPGVASVKLPALPADATFFTPTNPAYDIVGFVEATQISGYAAAKALPLTPNAGAPILDQLSTALPTNGTVRLSLMSEYD